jgi:hypothetical protein
MINPITVELKRVLMTVQCCNYPRGGSWEFNIKPVSATRAIEKLEEKLDTEYFRKIKEEGWNRIHNNRWVCTYCSEFEQYKNIIVPPNEENTLSTFSEVKDVDELLDLLL